MNRAAAKLRVAPAEWRWLYGAIVLAVAAMWIYQLKPVLSPVIAYIFLLALLRPFAGTQRHRVLTTAATAVMVVWVLTTLGSVLAPFIVAFVIAYILHPAASYLERRGLSRNVATAILALPILAILVCGVVFGLPALINQIESLLLRLPEAIQKIVASFEALRARIARSNMPFMSGSEVAAQLSIDQARVAAFIQAQQQQLMARAWGAVLGVGKGFSVALTVIGYLVLTPVLIIYLLRDFTRIADSVRGLVPINRRARTYAFMSEFDGLLAGFLRGQLTECTLVGILTWVGLMIVGFPYAGLVGVIAGMFNFIPYVGLIISFLPVVVIAALSGGFVAALIKAGIVFGIVQLIDSTITGPRIVGGSVGLHPIWVILSLAVGSFFFGFVGLLIAMPAAVLVKLLLRNAIRRYRESDVFTGAQSTEQEASTE